ncbi:MAG: SRPBCC domain-containing protein [Chloroflexota bacterium]
MIEPLRLSIALRCSATHAFETWTTRFATWWPRSHTMTGEPGVEIVLEGRVGGRIFERLRSGLEVDWGEVTLWEPPRKLQYLWHMRTDRSSATEVEITFVDLGDGTSRIEIEHRGWEQLGDRGPSWRDRNQAGWGGLIPHFVDACEIP